MLLGVLVCVATSPVNAQVSPLQGGVEAGVAIATLVGSGTDGAETRNAPYFGGSLLFHRPGSSIGFQTGLLYVPKGATIAMTGGRGALEIGYIEIPLLLRLGLPLEGSGVMPVLVVGGSVGLKSGCQLTASSGSASAQLDCDDSSLQGQFDLKAVDFGLTAGAELEIPVGPRLRVVPSVRYTRGISVIGDTANNADATNSVFQLGAGVRFSL
jgi:hypothetical protein